MFQRQRWVLCTLIFGKSYIDRVAYDMKIWDDVNILPAIVWRI